MKSFVVVLFLIVIATAMANPLQTLKSWMSKMDSSFSDGNEQHFQDAPVLEGRALVSISTCSKRKNIRLKFNDYATFWSKKFPDWTGIGNFTCRWNFRGWNNTLLQMNCPYIDIRGPDYLRLVDNGANKDLMRFARRNYTYTFSSNKGSVEFEKGNDYRTSLGFVCTMHVINKRTPTAPICYCGQPSKSSRINNAVDTTVDEFKWIVQFHSSSTSTHPVCAGTLLNDRYVLTAVACIKKFSSPPVIVLGNHKSSAVSYSSGAIFRNAKRNITHPDYNDVTFDNNIAIVELDVPINFRLAKNIRPICLPESNSELYGGRTSILAGWGRNNGKTPQVLQKFVSEIYASRDCGVSNYQIPLNGICAAKNVASASCPGDNGNPLMVMNNGEYEVVGTAFYEFCNMNLPFAFMRTTYYASWIRSKISDGLSCARE